MTGPQEGGVAGASAEQQAELQALARALATERLQVNIAKCSQM